MEIKTYHKQNKIQKEINSFMGLIVKDKKKIETLNRKGIFTYSPKLNKVKVGVFSFIVVACLLTPATNWLIIPALRWFLK